MKLLVSIYFACFKLLSVVVMYSKPKPVREVAPSHFIKSLYFNLLPDLYNLRGSDIEYNPVFFSYGVVTQKEAFLFVNVSQLTTAAKEALQAEEVKVTIKPYDELAIFISEQVGVMYLSVSQSLLSILITKSL